MFSRVAPDVLTKIRSLLTFDDQCRLKQADLGYDLPLFVDISASTFFKSMVDMVDYGLCLVRFRSDGTKKRMFISDLYCTREMIGANSGTLFSWRDSGEALAEWLCFSPGLRGISCVHQQSRLTPSLLDLFTFISSIWGRIATVVLYMHDGREFEYVMDTSVYQILYNDTQRRQVRQCCSRQDMLSIISPVTFAFYT